MDPVVEIVLADFSARVGQSVITTPAAGAARPIRIDKFFVGKPAEGTVKRRLFDLILTAAFILDI